MTRATFAFLIAFGPSLTHGADAVAVGGCSALLTLDPKDKTPLPAQTVDRITAGMTFGRLNDQSVFITEMARVIQVLVDEGLITREQAETLFANRVLGQYQPIFKKFVVAELKAREYDDSTAIAFILNFDKAFTARAQAEFALTVTQRMLLTLNDDPSTLIPEGVQQFLSHAAAFGIEPANYARFLETWTLIHAAHEYTVVRFILANLRHLGREMAASVTSLTSATPAPPPTRSRILMGWRFTKPAGAVTPRDPNAAARALLDNLAVPAFLTDVPSLRLSASEPPLMTERLFDRDEPTAARAAVSRLELAPPYARNFLVAKEIEHLGPSELRALRRWPSFQALDERVRARVDAELQRLAELEARAADVRRQWREEHPTSGRANLERAHFSESSVTVFVDEFRERVGDPIDRTLSDAALTNAVFDSLRAGKQRASYSGAEFMEGARRIMRLVCTAGSVSVAITVGNSLAVASRDFTLTEGGYNNFLAVIDLYEINHNSLRIFNDANPIFDRRHWGFRFVGEEDLEAIAKPSAALLPLLDAFTTALPPAEARSWTRAEILRMIVRPAKRNHGVTL